MSHTDEIKIAYQWYRLLEWKRRKELNIKYGCSDDNITNDVVLEIYNAEHSKAHKPTEEKELFTPYEWRFTERSEVTGKHSSLSSIPFAIEALPGGSCCIPIADICNFPPATEGQTNQQRANARLIASAPDLYHALKNIIEDWDNGMRGDKEQFKTFTDDKINSQYWSPSASLVHSEYIAKAREALNKAIGK